MTHLWSDQGPEFTAKVCQEILDYLKKTLHTNSAYHSQANGQCERLHRDLNAYLTTKSNELGTDWVNFLLALAHSLNTKVSSSTGHSPYPVLW